MNKRLILTLAISKLTKGICKLFGRGGTSLPGKIALVVYPDIARFLARDLKIIMVTGTNGKTSTTHFIRQFLEEGSTSCFTNISGANLVSGIVSSLIANCNLAGRFSCKTAILEVDEAAFRVITDYIEPDILVVSNFFRDQLDRYGELYNILNRVAEGISKTKKTSLVLNADDPLCASLGKRSDRSVYYYGFDDMPAVGNKEPQNLDSAYCIYCKSKYVYSYHTYAHLGGYTCPECGYSRPETDVACINVDKLDNVKSIARFYIKALDIVFAAYINLPGLYNIYNVLASATAGIILNVPVEKLVNAMSRLKSSFGRMETINAKGKKIKLILVKNPAGLNQVLDSLIAGQGEMNIAFVINDNVADGTDVSWLWDSDFEMLQSIRERIAGIYTSGSRCEEITIRLKYAGIYTDSITPVKDYRELIEYGLSKIKPGSCFYILANYTAMFDLRNILKKMFGLKELWT